MSDHAELKRLAEEQCISSDLGMFEDHQLCENILDLIAENERLTAGDQEATELCDCLSVLLGSIAVAVRGPEEPKTRHGFGDLPSRVKTVVAERDQLFGQTEQLKAENERLRKLPTCWSEVLEQSETNDELLDKVLELSRDAERYRWLRDEADPENWEGVCYLDPLEIDSRIDAAMGKGEQS